MKLSFQILFLLSFIYLSCFKKQPKENEKKTDLNIGFIDTVRANSKFSFTKIKMDTLSAENFKEIPYPFFKKYYTPLLNINSKDFSSPPNDTVYWRFSFLSFEKGQYFDFQTIIGYFEEDGLLIYLVKIDKKTNKILNIDEIAYYGGDGGYFESDVLIKKNAQSYENMHTVGETDDDSLIEDTLKTNLTIYDVKINVLQKGELKIDTLGKINKVDKQVNISK